MVAVRRTASDEIDRSTPGILTGDELAAALVKRDSRPILQRLGCVKLATTTPFVLPGIPL
jgi:hypothetical protein